MRLLSIILILFGLSTPAWAADYKAMFRSGDCGVLSMAGGKPTKYVYGRCDASGRMTQVTYTAPARHLSRSGSEIKIGAARFQMTSESSRQMTGKWRFRGQSQNVTFSR